MADTKEQRRVSANRGLGAINVCLEKLEPILHMMPEGGLVGRARAILLECKMQLVAARNEIGFGDPEDTQPRSPSQMMAAVRAADPTGMSGVRGIATRTAEILEEGKK